MLGEKIVRDISATQQRLLTKAMLVSWPVPVTGFLINARFEGGSLIGVVWHHSKAGLNGTRFSDGHLIVTSTVTGFREYSGCWLFKTLNSYYVVIDFAGELGSLLEAINGFPRIETVH